MAFAALVLHTQLLRWQRHLKNTLLLLHFLLFSAQTIACLREKEDRFLCINTDKIFVLNGIMKTEKFSLEAVTSRSVLSIVYTILLIGLLLVTLIINWIDIFTTEDSHAPINIPAKLWAPCFVSGVCLLLSYGFGTVIKLFGFDSSATTTVFTVSLRLSGITMCWSTLLSFSLVIFLQLEPDTARCHAPLADCDRSKNLPLEACLCMLFAPTILYFVFPHIRWWIIVLQYISSVVVVVAAISTSRAATRHVLLVVAMIVFSAYSLWQTRGSAFGAPFVVNGQEELNDFGAKLRCMISGIAHDLKSVRSSSASLHSSSFCR